MKVVIRSATGFTTGQLQKLQTAAILVERITRDPEFEQLILNYKRAVTTGHLWWKRTFTVDGFSENYTVKKDGSNNAAQTSQEIYDAFISGADLVDPVKDLKMDLNETLYSNYGSKVIGWTEFYSVKTYINSKFFDTFSVAEVAGNIIHEYCHSIGFGHKNSFYGTVPYAIGEIAVKVGERLMS